MSRNVTVYRLFLASPGDVAEDRDVVEQSLEEFNRLYTQSETRFEILRWEKHSVPSVAETYAQESINEQLLSEADAMIAIFGTRLGTPTPNAPSGTAEEVRFMLQRKQLPLGSYRLMVLFKKTQVDVLECNIDQIRALREFRDELQQSAVYYREYSTENELRSIITQSLGKITEIAHKFRGVRPTEQVPLVAVTSPAESEATELGLLDHQALFSSGMNEAHKYLEQCARLVSDFAQRTTENTDRLNAAATIGSTEQANAALNDQARLMEDSATALSGNSHLAKRAIETALGHGLDSVNLKLEDFGVDVSDAFAEWNTPIEELERSVSVTRESFQGFRYSVQSMPRISQQLNQARKNLLHALDDFDRLLAQTESSAAAIKSRVMAAVD